MRFSLALQDNNNYTPGIAFKFFTEKETNDSPSIVVMVNGQGRDTNFFRKPFFNEVLPAQGLALRSLEFSFQQALINLQARNTPSFVPVSKLSEINYEGQTIVDSSSPRILKLVARPEIITWMDQQLSNRGRTADIRSILSLIPPETTLYDVYGGSDRQNKHWELLGQIVLIEDNFKASRYGDEKLFFRHEFLRR